MLTGLARAPYKKTKKTRKLHLKHDGEDREMSVNTHGISI